MTSIQAARSPPASPPASCTSHPLGHRLTHVQAGRHHMTSLPTTLPSSTFLRITACTTACMKTHKIPIPPQKPSPTAVLVQRQRLWVPHQRVWVPALPPPSSVQTSLTYPAPATSCNSHAEAATGPASSTPPPGVLPKPGGDGGGIIAAGAACTDTELRLWRGAGTLVAVWQAVVRRAGARDGCCTRTGPSVGMHHRVCQCQQQ